jgi:hypothetical protein
MILRWYLFYCVIAGMISIVLGILIGVYFTHVPEYILVPGVIIEEPLTT